MKVVDQILAAKKKDPNADTSALEAEIDQLVYKLYDLTPEEIATVEGGAKKEVGRASGEKPAAKQRRAAKPKTAVRMVEDDENLE